MREHFATSDPAHGTIRVVAALITDPAGRLLLVRKRGTRRWMQAGGKPEPGESTRAALVRELAEELDLRVEESALTPVGAFTTRAANEAGHALEAVVFSLALPDTVAQAVAPHAELAEIRWTSPPEAMGLGDALAPLARLLLPT